MMPKIFDKTLILLKADPESGSAFSDSKSDLIVLFLLGYALVLLSV